jgi:hypothetical protein
MGPWPDNEAWLSTEATQFQVVGHGVWQEDVVPPTDEVKLGCTGLEPGTKIDRVPEQVAWLGMRQPILEMPDWMPGGQTIKV